MAAFKQLMDSTEGIKGKKGKQALDATKLWVRMGKPLYNTHSRNQTIQDEWDILYIHTCTISEDLVPLSCIIIHNH